MDISLNYQYNLELAVNGNHAGILKLLLSDKRIDPSAKDNIAIIYAVSKGEEELVKRLLQDPRVDPNVEAGKKRGVSYSLLNTAVEYQYPKIVDLLLNDSRVSVSQEVLTQACRSKNLEIIKMILWHPKLRLEDNSNLIAACKNGNLALVKLFLSRGLDCSPDCNSAVIEAVQSNHPQVLKALMAHVSVQVYYIAIDISQN